MTSKVWLGLNESERRVLRQALLAYAGGEAVDCEAINALAKKVATVPPHQTIIIRVNRGYVEDIEHNPVPVVLYDYDIDGADDLGRDDSGRHCVVSEYEPRL
ncbi:MAG: hypothetical protein KGJ81_10115 [Alphaproteobacteria bacterium]|nr:hypothetical protein [Alphaproteobacteria bacterium]